MTVRVPHCNLGYNFPDITYRYPSVINRFDQQLFTEVKMAGIPIPTHAPSESAVINIVSRTGVTMYGDH